MVSTKDYIDQIKDHIDTRFDRIENDVKTNTKFRQKASGVIVTLGVIASVIGAGITWLIQYLGGK